MGRAKRTAEPQLRFNERSVSRAVVIRGVTKYLPVGELVEGAPKGVYRVEVREARDVPIAAFYAAFLLTENMARGPEAAEITVANSDCSPVRLTTAAINGLNPAALQPAHIREMYDRLGIKDFGDIMVSEQESHLSATLQVIGMGAAAVRACDERQQFVA